MLLWAVFLITQMEKAKHGRCTWQFAAILAFQTIMLASVALAALYYESHKFKVSSSLICHDCYPACVPGEQRCT